MLLHIQKVKKKFKKSKRRRKIKGKNSSLQLEKLQENFEYGEPKNSRKTQLFDNKKQEKFESQMATTNYEK